jgi:hypothetical protein
MGSKRDKKISSFIKIYLLLLWIKDVDWLGRFIGRVATSLRRKSSNTVKKYAVSAKHKNRAQLFKMAATKKDGGANSKFWDSQDIVEKLENIRTWLVKNSRKV